MGKITALVCEERGDRTLGVPVCPDPPTLPLCPTPAASLPSGARYPAPISDRVGGRSIVAMAENSRSIEPSRPRRAMGNAAAASAAAASASIFRLLCRRSPEVSTSPDLLPSCGAPSASLTEPAAAVPPKPPPPAAAASMCAGRRRKRALPPRLCRPSTRARPRRSIEKGFGRTTSKPIE